MKTLKMFLVVAALALPSRSAQSAILAAVPMQGGMVMPMVSYHAAAGRVEVMMPSDVPQLTPLLISHPADAFAPDDPWFDELDPGRRGASFSRRFGFVMAAETDSLPADTQLWIRKLSGPAGLKVFRYSGSAPKAVEPIFGTEGVTNARAWNGTMFHPLFTAPPGTNALVATFEVFLVDTNTGLEVAGSASGPLTFRWTNVLDGRPALSFTPDLRIAWSSATATNWALESAGVIDANEWTAVTTPPELLDGQFSVPVDRSAGPRQFFRMRYMR